MENERKMDYREGVRMSKLMIKTRQLWCVSCHSTKNTLRKISDVRMCVCCLDKIHKYGKVTTYDGGTLEQSKDTPGLIVYIPKEEENNITE